jgi:hypothetical protein
VFFAYENPIFQLLQRPTEAGLSLAMKNGQSLNIGMYSTVHHR